MKMKKVRQKPIVFDAIQWNPGTPLPAGVKVECIPPNISGEPENIYALQTPQGYQRIHDDFWILKHPDGSSAAFPNEVFEALFEDVTP